MDDEMLTDDQAAALVRRRPRTIREWRRAGLIKSRWLFDRESGRERWKTKESQVVEAEAEARRRMMAGRKP